MAVAVPVQVLPDNGAPLNPTYTTGDASGHELSNSGNEIILLKNVGASPITVDVEGVPAPDSGRDVTISVVVAAGEERLAGPYKPRNWNTNTGLLEFAVSAGTETDLRIAAIKVGRG